MVGNGDVGTSNEEKDSNNHNSDVNNGKKKKRNGYQTRPDDKSNNQINTKIKLKSDVWIPLNKNNTASYSTNSSAAR